MYEHISQQLNMEKKYRLVVIVLVSSQLEPTEVSNVESTGNLHEYRSGFKMLPYAH